LILRRSTSLIASGGSTGRELKSPQNQEKYILKINNFMNKEEYFFLKKYEGKYSMYYITYYYLNS
jgi:hypothetical protein